VNDELDTDTHDFAMDGTAQVHRELKVKALRQWLWDHGVYSWEVALWERWNPALLRRCCRDTGVNPPRPDSPTWGMVIADLRKKEAWAARHPTDPKATRTGQRPLYLPEPVPEPTRSRT
jgi:hypothetical protein